jgi:aspartate aminotransferase/aromatic-amino-acid transaminase
MNYRPFSTVETAPPDPILGLTEAYRKDANAQKVNLTSGVYMDESGVNPVLRSVKQAERMLLELEKTKDYLGMGGDESYARAVQRFMLGAQHPVVTEGRAATVQTPGGTGALRVGGEFLRTQFPGATMWVSDPTWPNHHGIFKNAGLKVDTYPYYDAATHGLKFGAMLAALEQIPDGDIVLLHGCCHNPTGVDPTPDQWDQLVALFVRRPIIAFVDFAYQGFGRGVEDDAYAVRAFASAGLELVITSSFSKNFGLYRERVGALTVVTGSSKEVSAVLSRVKLTIRANYSNPPAHGAKVVELVFSEAELRKLWEQEVVEMRDRIHEMRRLFVETLKKYGVKRNFDFLMDQQGMFSFSGIGKEEVIRLRERYGIYLVENGRINVAAMTRARMDYICQSIAEVLQG